MKKNTNLSILFIICLFFLGSINKCRAESYKDEGVAFYVQNSPSGYSIEGIAFYAFATQPPTGTAPVYRYFNATSGDHFYTTDNISTYGGYTSEGIAFYTYSAPTSNNASPVYRFYNSLNNKHFYTSNEDERDALNNNPQWGYTYEGIVFYAQSVPSIGTVPIYRFLNAVNGDHFYTANEEEKNAVSQAPVYRFYNPKTGHHFFTASENEKSIVANTSHSGFIPEGTAFSVQTSQILGTSPVYRFNSDSTGDHFYTISEDEKNYLINNPQNGYVYEGIAFYASAIQRPGYYPLYRFNNPSNSDHFYTILEEERQHLLIPALGPEISVGLWYYSKTDIQNNNFKISANKNYNIRNASGNILAQVNANSTTSVSYDDNKNQLTVEGPIGKTLAGTNVTFDAADGDNSNLIFNTNRSSFVSNDYRGTIDKYRGKMKVQYYRGPDIVADKPANTVTQIWIDNILPLEQYVWGSAETSGTGNINHTQAMITAYRTYGFWYIKYANKYAAYGFKIRSDSGSQNYGGYSWEANHPNVKIAAQNTRAIIATYNADVALTPYSSASDGRTRSWQEKWGGTDYPWCQSVPDPYGKDLARSAASHMVGLIGDGSNNLASNYGWDWQNILHYYFTGITLQRNY